MSISSVEGFSKLYNFFIPFIKPKSPKGNTSILPNANIKYISAVHLPIPRTFVNSEITFSLDIFLKILKSSFLSTIILDRSKIYSAFILDSPIDFISSLDNLITSEGEGYFFPNKFLNFKDIDFPAASDIC